MLLTRLNQCLGILTQPSLIVTSMILINALNLVNLSIFNTLETSHTSTVALFVIKFIDYRQGSNYYLYIIITTL